MMVAVICRGLGGGVVRPCSWDREDTAMVFTQVSTMDIMAEEALGVADIS